MMMCIRFKLCSSQNSIYNQGIAMLSICARLTQLAGGGLWNQLFARQWHGASLQRVLWDERRAELLRAYRWRFGVR